MAKEKNLHEICAFCGKPINQVNRFYSSMFQGVGICDGCIREINKIAAKEHVHIKEKEENLDLKTQKKYLIFSIST